MELSEKDFTGSWDSNNIPPYKQNDEIVLRLYFGDTSNLHERTGKGRTFFQGKFTFNQVDKTTFQLLYKGADVDKDYETIEGYMFMTGQNQPPSFVATIPGFGKRIFFKVSG